MNSWQNRQRHAALIRANRAEERERESRPTIVRATYNLLEPKRFGDELDSRTQDIQGSHVALEFARVLFDDVRVACKWLPYAYNQIQPSDE